MKEKGFKGHVRNFDSLIERDTSNSFEYRPPAILPAIGFLAIYMWCLDKIEQPSSIELKNVLKLKAKL